MTTQSGPAAAPMPDPERLALLMEGRLPRGEREALLARIATSPDDLAMLADAAVAARDSAAPKLDANALARRQVGRWLVLAAAVATIVIIPTYLLQSSRTRSLPGSETDPIARYVTLLDDRGGIPVGFDLAPWGTTRSISESIPASQTPWRLGARLVDLEVAAAAGDTAIVGNLAREVAVLLEGLGVAAPLRSVFLDRPAIVRGQAAWLDQMRDARALIVAQVQDERVALAAWAEAGRFAANRLDASFFRSDETAAAMVRLREIGILTPSLQAVLERAAGPRDPSPAEWQELAAGLRELLATR